MNNYKKLINIIKPEFQDLYAITKNVGEENTFQFTHIQMNNGNKTFDTMMTFRNVQNTMAVMKNGKNPYVSDVASVYSKDIYKHLTIPDNVSDLIYFTMNLNDKKNEMHLFFENILRHSYNLLPNHEFHCFWHLFDLILHMHLLLFPNFEIFYIQLLPPKKFFLHLLLKIISHFKLFFKYIFI